MNETKYAQVYKLKQLFLMQYTIHNRKRYKFTTIEYYGK